MTMQDFYRVINPIEKIAIFNKSKRYFVFLGAAQDIPLELMNEVIENIATDCILGHGLTMTRIILTI